MVLLILIFGFYSRAYCQEINAKQSVKNATAAWESIFPGKKCVLLYKRNDKYETHVYEMKSIKCEVVKTNSRVNPYKLKVRIEIEAWSSREKKTTIKEALANVEEKGDRLPGAGTAAFPMTGLYNLEDGNWLFTAGNKQWMIFFRKARAKYNTHVNVSIIYSIPEK